MQISYRLSLITIITATFNAAATLEDNLVCILDQNTPVEHLLIDGASTDGTLDIIEGYCSGPSPLTKVISEPDKGIYDAMNKGLKLAQGDIIGILNADDFYTDAEVLSKVEQAFKDPQVGVCYGDLTYVRQNREVSGEKRENPPSFDIVRYWKSGSFHPNKFYWGWMPPHPTFFVRRTVYEKYGLFNLELGSAADYEIMLRFLLKHKVKAAYIPEVLVNMRVGGASNASVGNRLKANRNDRKAWEVNELKPYPWTMVMKPARKLPQWVLRPPVGGGNF